MTSPMVCIDEFPSGTASTARAVAYLMHDQRFMSLISELVEVHPDDWQDIEIIASALNIKRNRLSELKNIPEKAA